MHRFTLLHDGSEQGWRATYLALHVATHLGAPIQVLHIDLLEQQSNLAQRAEQVEIGGRAAGVSITTDFLAEYSKDALNRYAANVDGCFAPRPLVSDVESVSLFLEAFHAPVWSVSIEAKHQAMVVLVSDPVVDAQLIYTAGLFANRLHQPLTGFILDAQVEALAGSKSAGFKWRSFPEFSAGKITEALFQFQADLLFTSAANFKLSAEVPVNCVIVPAPASA